MPKTALKKDDLEAVLEDGEPEIQNEQDEADFLAAFDEEDNGYVDPDPKPAEEPAPADADPAPKADEEEEGDEPTPEETTPGDPPEEDTDPDEDGETPPWMKHLQEMENRISSRMRNVEGHIGGLKSQMMQAKQEATAEGDSTPTAAQIKDATGRKGSTEKLDALRTEFPEWAEALDELAENYGPTETVAPDTFTKQEVATLVQDAVKQGRELAKVDAAHPGWEELRYTPEFTHWRESQPEETQKLADSSKAADAIKMFDLYKEATTPAAPANKGKSEERLKRSVAPQTTGAAPVQHVPTEEEDFLAGFNS